MRRTVSCLLHEHSSGFKLNGNAVGSKPGSLLCQSVSKFCTKGSVSSKSQDYTNSPKVSLQENWARLISPRRALADLSAHYFLSGTR